MQEGAAEEGQGACIIFLSAMSGVVYLQLGLDFFLSASSGMRELSLVSPLKSEVFFSTSPALPSGESAVCYR